MPFISAHNSLIECWLYKCTFNNMAMAMDIFCFRNKLASLN